MKIRSDTKIINISSMTVFVLQHDEPTSGPPDIDILGSLDNPVPSNRILLEEEKLTPRLDCLPHS